MMRPYELRVAFVACEGDGGKRRPALILSFGKERVSAYAITTQYENKSQYIKANYFAVKDWKRAGLNRPSYIDTNNIIKLSRSSVDNTPIGKLSQKDEAALIEFLVERA